MGKDDARRWRRAVTCRRIIHAVGMRSRIGSDPAGASWPPGRRWRRGDQRERRGGCQIGEGTEPGQESTDSTISACSGGVPSGSSRSATAHSGGGGTNGATAVGTGADLPEHCGPSHGVGTGAGSAGPRSEWNADVTSMPIAGRSLGCEQPAWAKPGNNRPIARSVLNAPTPAHARCSGLVARMKSTFPDRLRREMALA